MASTVTVEKTIEVELFDDGTRWTAQWRRQDDPYYCAHSEAAEKYCAHALTRAGVIRKAKRVLKRHARRRQFAAASYHKETIKVDIEA